MENEDVRSSTSPRRHRDHGCTCFEHPARRQGGACLWRLVGHRRSDGQGARRCGCCRRRRRTARRSASLIGLSKLSDSGVKAVAIDLDVTDENACQAAVERTRSELDGLDIVVNAAGLMLLGPIVGADTEDWRRMMSTNVLGLMYLTHAAVPGMVDQASGDIVNISSVAGRVARSGAGAYNASKWAVNAFSESLRQEVTGKGVRISVIEPGAVLTELNDHVTDPDAKKASEDSYASMDSLQADDVARAITYVVSQPANVAINEILVRPTDQTR